MTTTATATATATATTTTYALGSSNHEIERLDRQAASIEAATRLLLRASGIEPGMRVLDLGTGIGHVALLAAELVGPQGHVDGIDNRAKLLEVAAARAAGRPQLRFVDGLAQPQGFGAQSYAVPDDPRGPALFSGVVRTLAPRIVEAGLASAARIGLDTFEQRVAAEMRASGSVMVLPTLDGAWGRRC